MSVEYCRNQVRVVGTISSEVVIDHVSKHGEMYGFMIRIPRTSGTIDELPVVITKGMFEKLGKDLEIGKECTIKGEYRSCNLNYHLKLYIFAKEIYIEDDHMINNEAILEGYISNVKPPRVTPKGKKIIDIMLAVNRGYKSSYIPCIIWNYHMYDEEIFKVGNKVFVIGRIQSREYIKRYEDSTEELKIAYELSASNIELIEKKEEKAVI